MTATALELYLGLVGIMLALWLVIDAAVDIGARRLRRWRLRRATRRILEETSRYADPAFQSPSTVAGRSTLARGRQLPRADAGRARGGSAPSGPRAGYGDTTTLTASSDTPPNGHGSPWQRFLARWRIEIERP